MKLRGIGIGLLALTTIFGLSFSVFATMTSTNYEIQWDEINAGGGEGSSSASYQLRDSVQLPRRGAMEQIMILTQGIEQEYMIGLQILKYFFKIDHHKYQLR